jgi:hypothetical protein
MEATYTIIGSDGQQYGPISLEQVKIWIGERRIGPETKVLRSDTNSWLPASQYGELGLVPEAQPVQAAATPMPTPAAAITGNPVLQIRARVGARWFYWIAGFSLVNTIMAMAGQGLVFVVGLAVTREIGNFAANAGTPAVGLVLDAVVAGVFVLCGVFAGKGQTWSFIVGIVLYALDAFLLIGQSLMAVGDVSLLMLAFHGYILFRLSMGLKANMELKSAGRG